MARIIAFTVEEANWPTFKKYFLMIHPNQTVGSTSVMSDDEWIGHRILLFARGSYIKGFSQEYFQHELPPVIPNIIMQT